VRTRNKESTEFHRAARAGPAVGTARAGPALGGGTAKAPRSKISQGLCTSSGFTYEAFSFKKRKTRPNPARRNAPWSANRSSNRRATESKKTRLTRQGFENHLPDLNSVALDVACEKMKLFTAIIVFIKLNSMFRSSEHMVF